MQPWPAACFSVRVLLFFIFAATTSVSWTGATGPANPVTVEVSADVAAAANATPAADGTVESGMAVLEGAVVVSSPAVDVKRRGLAFCDRHGGSADNACLWVFTGVEPVDTDSVQATVRGSWMGGLGGDKADNTTSEAATFEESVTGRILGAQVEHRLQWQPQAGLRDSFWRSGRGLLRLHHEFVVPPMWSFGNQQTRLSAMQASVGLGKWYAPSKAGWTEAAWDRNVAIQGAVLLHKRWRFSLIEGSLFSAGVQTSQTSTEKRGRSVDVLTLDGLVVSRGFGQNALRFNAGLQYLSPVTDYVRRGNSESSAGGGVSTPRVNVMYQRGDFTTPEQLALQIGGGTWARISPSGLSADVGYAGNVSTQGPIAGLTLRLDGNLGRARRAAQTQLADVTEMAVTELTVGQQFWFARGEATFSKALGHGLNGALQLWVERSDRDNPQQPQLSDGEFRIATGGQVSLGWVWAK